MLSKYIETFQYSLQVAKFPLCLLVAFSSLFGFVFYSEDLNKTSGIVFIGVLLLACGGATLNSYQERKSDAFMQRTSNRPLVHGRLSHPHVIIQASLLVFCSFLILFYVNKVSALAGLAGIILYNLIYTRLKTETLYSLVPGALCGAVPPYMGWVAAGGEFISFKALLPMVLLVFWQVPHFLLVLLNHKMDYLQSVSPNVLKSLSEDGVRRIFLPWITALATTMLTFSMIPSALNSIGRIIVVINALVLLAFFYYQLLSLNKPNYQFLFRYLNVSIFLLMLLFFITALDFTV